MADITPVTREEFYLAKAGGQDVPVPSAVTREEYYLEKLTNDSVVVPTPVTRREKFLYFACGGEIDLPSEGKMTRLERLIAKAGGMDVATPTAITRLEKFWKNVEGGGWNVTELTGTLPMTFRSNGTALINYRIYGTADGVGVQTENLFDGTYCEGFIDGSGKYLNETTTRTAFIKVEANTQYCVKTFDASNRFYIALYDHLPDFNDVGNRVAYSTAVTEHSYTLTTSADTAYVGVYVSNQNYEPRMACIKGSIAPATYIPYGYKLPLKVTNGTESKDTDIYIGDTKLLSGDYVDYGSGKIVRNGTPQDPPLPLPAIETFNGENTLDSTETLGEVTIKGKIKEAE